MTRPRVPSRTVAAALENLAGQAEAQAKHENFPVALRIVPAHARRCLMTAYRYARFVDDIGDEAPGDADFRLELLDAVEADVRRLGVGARTGTGTAVRAVPELPIVAALAPLVRDYGVPIQTLCDLIEANRMDQRVHSYANFEDLLGYCTLSAAPIGRIVLAVAQAGTADNVRDSDVICSALQVLEHCQDVGEDAAKSRVYLPQADLDRYGVSTVAPAAVTAATTSPALRAVILKQVGRAEDMIAQSSGLIGRLRGWSRLAVSGYIAGGQLTASALRRADAEVLARAVRPSKPLTLLRAARLATVGARR